MGETGHLVSHISRFSPIRLKIKQNEYNLGTGCFCNVFIFILYPFQAFTGDTASPRLLLSNRWPENPWILELLELRVTFLADDGRLCSLRDTTVDNSENVVER